MSDERRATSDESGDTRQTLTPALRRYQKTLARGYRIEVHRVADQWGASHLQPKLVNADGAVVQSVRWDTYRRLQLLGIVEPDEARDKSAGDG